MKIRTDYVTNSSSSSFIVTNISDKPKDIYDFAKEVSFLVDVFNEEYGGSFSKEDFLNDAKRYDKYSLEAGKSKEFIFGDEQGTVMGHVLDYAMRDGGTTESFSWYYHDSYR